MELTTHLVQESRPTRLFVRTPYAAGPRTINGDLTLYVLVFLQSLSPSHNRWMCDFRLQPEYPAKGNGLQIELIPLHSPLLRESLLVSFPPLNNMLKFSGFSYLIWDQKFIDGITKSIWFNSHVTESLKPLPNAIKSYQPKTYWILSTFSRYPQDFEEGPSINFKGTPLPIREAEKLILRLARC